MIISFSLHNSCSNKMCQVILTKPIVVHHREKTEDGSTFQQIEIYYRFVGKLTAGNELSEAA